MRCDKTMTMAAAILLALGLTARAEDEQDVSRTPEAETAEQRRDTEAAERERRRDREAAQQERRRDAETAEGERRRDEVVDRDRERINPVRRGRARGQGAMPRMQGPGAMPGMPGGMPRMPGMMMGPGMDMGGMPSLPRLRESDPEMFELEQNDQRLDRESHALAEQYRRATEGPARDELRAKVQETVKQHFKARQERRELEVKRLQAQLERLRGAVERRAKDADTIIEQRVSQLLGEEEFGF